MKPIPADPDAPAPEADDRFPSGPWTGFFLQREVNGKCWMELDLRFSRGLIRGQGRDRVGEFLIRGRYQLDDGKCWLSKRYVGKHDVAYLGYNEGKGIWGNWEIPPLHKGGFHIWPVAMGDPTKLALKAELDLPAPEPEVAPSKVQELVGVPG